jgi:hypothetical protein
VEREVVAALQVALQEADQGRGLALQYGAALYSLTEAVAAVCALPLRVCAPAGARVRTVLEGTGEARCAPLPPNTLRLGSACWGDDKFTCVWCTGAWPLGLVPAQGAVLVAAPAVIDVALARLGRSAYPICQGPGLVVVKLV